MTKIEYEKIFMIAIGCRRLDVTRVRCCCGKNKEV